MRLAARFAFSGDRRIDEWGCSECKGTAFASQDWKRKARNCDGTRDVDLGFEWAPELKRCPFSIIREESWHALHLWSAWKRFGGLPEHGTLFDQPAPVTEAIKLCETVREEMERTRAEQDLAKAKRKAKRRGDE